MHHHLLYKMSVPGC